MTASDGVIVDTPAAPPEAPTRRPPTDLTSLAVEGITGFVADFVRDHLGRMLRVPEPEPEPEVDPAAAEADPTAGDSSPAPAATGVSSHAPGHNELGKGLLLVAMVAVVATVVVWNHREK